MSIIQGFTIVVDKTDMQPCSNKALSFYNKKIYSSCVQNCDRLYRVTLFKQGFKCL